MAALAAISRKVCSCSEVCSVIEQITCSLSIESVSSQRLAVSGQRSAVSGQRSAVSGQRLAVSLFYSKVPITSLAQALALAFGHATRMATLCERHCDCTHKHS
ncbi:hypothetical protein [Moorena sp. SIO3I6]|uniref:hypothetical protein n=1 Tax=Moorena sp. SIO3I6 TaxID=2607831 RepID=UPI0013FA38BC|nr:hypothetical protein [Moorena sp. SIO3I6]NEP24894.1 hypothetical protein [Moorena sp. SIO3I6]